MTLVRCLACLFVYMVSAFVADPKGAQFKRYQVGPNVQVSLSQSTLQHYETQIAADAEQAGHLIAGAYVVRPDHSIDNFFYVSFDHGRTWIHTLTVPSEGKCR